MTNNATITIECGGTITYDAASFSGNPPKQNCTSTVVRDQATCVAAGGSYTAAVRECVLLNFTVAANKIFELTSSTTLSRVTIAGQITNNGMFKTNNVMVFSTAVFDNKGTMTLASRVDWNMGSIQNNGAITIQNVGSVTIAAQAAVTNNGAITVACGGSFTNNGAYTGALPQYIDCTAPTATPRQSPAAIGGWTNSNVTVFWTWRDNTGGSGLDTTRCTQSSTNSGEGVQTLIATCQDKAGNIGSASYTVKVDKTPPVANPTLSPAPNAAGWNTSQPVTVNWNWTDSGSGIINGPCVTSSSATSEGVQTLTAYCLDEMENYAEASYTVKIDRALPLIVAKVSPAPSGFGWYPGAVTVSFTCQEATGSGLASNTVGGNVTLSNEGSYPAVTNTGSCTDNAGNVATPVTVGPFNIDLTKPTISAAATTAPNANGWYNSNVTVHFTCADALSGIAFCPPDQGLSSEGSAVSSTAQTARDKTQNVSDPSNVVTVKLDKTAPVVVITGVTNGATYAFGSVPTTACSTSDALSAVATQATLALTGGNGNGSGAFTATCSGATDLAGNSAAPVSVSYTVGAPPPTATLTNTPVPPTATLTNTPVPPTAIPTNTPVPPTATPTNTSVPPTATPTNTPVPPTNTPVPPTATPTNTPVPPTAIPTNTPVPPTETPTNTLVPPTDTPTNTPALPTETPTNMPVPPTATPLPAGDACTTTALRDDFNRADGDLGVNWAGLIDQSFYKLAGNQLDVQLGGAVVWKPTTFGVNQAAAVTLSALDPFSPAQGVLLKVQTGAIPSAGAIAVVYDSLAKAVRVSTLRLNAPAWSAYPNVPATFVNGDKLTGCAQADGTVRVYKNNSLLTTVTLNAEDQSFFNAKGGKIGLWTVVAPNALFDDFGGGALAAVTSAAAGEQAVPDEVADDGAALVVDSVLITASVPVTAPAVVDAPVATATPAVAPVDATAPAAPESSEQNQRIFLPIITNVAALAGAALGGPGGLAMLVVVTLLVVGAVVRRRQRHR